MKRNKLLLPTIFLVVAILATAVFSFVNCIAKKPTVTEAEFPFSITYELNGETITIEDVFSAKYTANSGYNDTKTRCYDGQIVNNSESSSYYTILKYGDGSCIELHTKFYADYLMGDPEYDYFDDESFEPQLLYYDAEGIEFTSEEILAVQGVKLVSFEYPVPIENSIMSASVYSFLLK